MWLYGFTCETFLCGLVGGCGTAADKWWIDTSTTITAGAFWYYKRLYNYFLVVCESFLAVRVRRRYLWILGARLLARRAAGKGGREGVNRVLIWVYLPQQMRYMIMYIYRVVYSYIVGVCILSVWYMCFNWTGYGAGYIFVVGHTTTKIPDPIRTPKSNVVRPG